jgi:hypothetical protein
VDASAETRRPFRFGTLTTARTSHGDTGLNMHDGSRTWPEVVVVHITAKAQVGRRHRGRSQSRCAGRAFPKWSATTRGLLAREAAEIDLLPIECILSVQDEWQLLSGAEHLTAVPCLRHARRTRPGP